MLHDVIVVVISNTALQMTTLTRLSLQSSRGGRNRSISFPY
jgi:hypothetical protein